MHAARRLDFSERRKSLRYPSWNRALIVTSENKRHHCLIEDVSEVGARLNSGSAIKLPEKFTLFALGGENEQGQEVVWEAACRLTRHEEHHAAVEFTTAPTQSEDLPDDLLQLLR